MTRDVGGVDYDDSARLRAGLNPEPGPQPQPIELHLLERRVAAHEDEDATADERYVDPTDPSHWEAIEREAYLVGQRMLDLRASGMTVEGKPLEWGHMAVLLRATQYSAQRLADVLGRMGIPTYAEAGDALLEATEVRDVLALLQVLDNPQQDIPLASALRSGIAGMAFSEDDLAAIRCLDREVPFHAACRRCANSDSDGDLPRRLGLLLDRLTGWRREARRRPVADVLWKIYQEAGYLAYAGGLSQGRFRRANLLALHERARQFGGFRRQGLHRFLRFIESLEEAGEDLRAAPPLGEARDAVRIVSIHRAKGLEFPVVFLADLGHRFNFSDARSRIVFDRRSGIGMRVVEPDRMIEYPSLQHLRVAGGIESATRDEELRILYVALTRAKQRLILVGSTPLAAVRRDRDLWRGLGRQDVSPSVQPAGTPLDWIVPALAAAPADRVRWSDEPAAGDPGATILYQVDLHSEDEMRDWHPERTTSSAQDRVLQAASRLGPLPADEPRHAVGFDAAAVLGRIDYPYPNLEASSVRAVVGASEAKRAIEAFADDHQPRGQPFYRPSFDAPAALGEDPQQDTRRQRGTLTHRVLESADLGKPISDELQRLVSAGHLSQDEAAVVDVRALEWFADTPLGRRIREAGSAYRREFRFVSAEPAATFDPLIEGECDDRVLVRGIADGVLPGQHGLEVVEFKTDAIDAAHVEERAKRYELQVQLYASAVGKVWGEPVACCWLVFLAPRRIIEVDCKRGVR
jgi:ATP-dependent helicase/nuclease subunit A